MGIRDELEAMEAKLKGIKADPGEGAGYNFKVAKRINKKRRNEGHEDCPRTPTPKKKPETP